MTALTNQLDSQGRRHGVWEYYYPNGTLIWRRHYLHGEVHGVREYYYQDGTLWERGKFLHGEWHGLWKHYHEDGTQLHKAITSELDDYSH